MEDYKMEDYKMEDYNLAAHGRGGRDELHCALRQRGDDDQLLDRGGGVVGAVVDEAAGDGELARCVEELERAHQVHAAHPHVCRGDSSQQ